MCGGSGGSIVSLLQSRDQLPTQQKVGTPEFSWIPWGENDRGKLRVTQGYEKSKKKKETNKQLRKERRLGNRWGAKRCENHKGRVTQEEREEGWGERKLAQRVRKRRKLLSAERGPGRWWKDNGGGRSMFDLCWPLRASREEFKGSGRSTNPNVMGNPAVCPLTPLPPAVMSVPIAFRVTSAGRGCDTNTQETHSCDDVHMCTHTYTHIGAQMDDVRRPSHVLTAKKHSRTNTPPVDSTNVRSQGRFDSGHHVTQKCGIVLKS